MTFVEARGVYGGGYFIMPHSSFFILIFFIFFLSDFMPHLLSWFQLHVPFLRLDWVNSVNFIELCISKTDKSPPLIDISVEGYCFLFYLHVE
jgi:hypothetical protein